jgi:hypothetical protein
LDCRLGMMVPAAAGRSENSRWAVNVLEAAQAGLAETVRLI